MVVFIDPGHNGSNDGSINRQVPTGRGGTKDCQTTGTATNTGFMEHTFTWDTALRVRAALNALGVRTAMSRGNDTGLGPCVSAVRTPRAFSSARSRNAVSQVNVCSIYPLLVEVPLVWQSLVPPRPVGTWRLMDASLDPL